MNNDDLEKIKKEWFIETKREWIMDRLLTIGEITRNECLRKLIFNLSGHICAIKEQNPTWQIDVKTIKTPNGKVDYIYKLTNRDEILENINKN